MREGARILLPLRRRPQPPLTTTTTTTTRTGVTSFDCSLNGVCSAGACTCDSPWVGVACETLQYAVTPASGKNLFTGDPNLNTWNGCARPYFWP